MLLLKGGDINALQRLEKVESPMQNGDSMTQKVTIPWARSTRRLRSAGGCRQCRGAVWALALRRCSQVGRDKVAY